MNGNLVSRTGVTHAPSTAGRSVRYLCNPRAAHAPVSDVRTADTVDCKNCLRKIAAAHATALAEHDARAEAGRVSVDVAWDWAHVDAEMLAHQDRVRAAMRQPRCTACGRPDGGPTHRPGHSRSHVFEPYARVDLFEVGDLVTHPGRASEGAVAVVLEADAGTVVYSYRDTETGGLQRTRHYADPPLLRLIARAPGGR